MRNWTPFIKDALAELAAAGVTRVIGIPMAPQFSTLSVQKYIDAATAGAAGRHALRTRSSRFITHPLLLDAFAERVRAAHPQPDELVVFTAHSLPARVIEAGDAYADEVAATASAVAARAGIGRIRARLSERRPHARAVDRPGAGALVIDERGGQQPASSSSCRSASSAITPRSCSTSTSRPREAAARSSRRRCGGPSR